MKLIAFVGMPASGKSEAAAIAKNFGIPVVNMGDVVREETAQRGLPPTDENIGGTGTSLRREKGMDIIAKRCVPKIRLIKNPVVVVDGTRNINEIEYFKKEFGNDFMLIAIHTPFEMRFERVRKRARSDDMNSAGELKRRDEREKGWGLDKAIEKADITIDNIETIEKFRKQIELLLGKI
ncbi:MAG: flagellar hook-basal body complex protein FliE [Candidatus Methanoperedens sp.]|nr:flagellar hook-basal body complex protein FliE [Candidatus Methanoperedens sp.]